MTKEEIKKEIEEEREILFEEILEEVRIEYRKHINNVIDGKEDLEHGEDFMAKRGIEKGFLAGQKSKEDEILSKIDDLKNNKHKSLLPDFKIGYDLGLEELKQSIINSPKTNPITMPKVEVGEDSFGQSDLSTRLSKSSSSVGNKTVDRNESEGSIDIRTSGSSTQKKSKEAGK